MSLLDAALEDYVFLNKTKVPDGYGGYIEVWTEGATIKVAEVLNSSMEARIALAGNVKSVYTLTTRKANKLEYHDVLKRKSDSKIFRVTSDGDDNKTPGSAGLDMRQVSAEEWELPDGQTTSV